MAADGSDYVDEVLADLDISGEGDYGDPDFDTDEMIVGQLVEVGALEEVGARKVLRVRDMRKRRALLAALMRRASRGIGRGKPSPPFARSARETERRAPLGFIEDGTGANFFSLAAAIGATTTMRGKVSRTAHPDRLLIVPSAPGAVLQSLMVGDDEQLLASGAPVELYSTSALTDQIPDNFSPIGPALDFVVTLQNTTAVAITGTIGIKAACKR